MAEGIDAEPMLCRVAVPVPRTRELNNAPRLYNELVTAAYREAGHSFNAYGVGWITSHCLPLPSQARGEWQGRSWTMPKKPKSIGS
jgi:hypothetical protein